MNRPDPYEQPVPMSNDPRELAGSALVMLLSCNSRLRLMADRGTTISTRRAQALATEIDAAAQLINQLRPEETDKAGTPAETQTTFE